MTDYAHILGQQANPTSETELYAVPDKTGDTVAADILTEVTCSTLVICNRTAGALTFRVSITAGGAVGPIATSAKDYIFYDTPIAANTTITATLGLTLEQNDSVRVVGSATGLSFSLFGVETF